jgi:hypothetical protein
LRIFAVNKPATLNVPWSTQPVTVALLPNAVTPIPVNDPSAIVPLPAVNDKPTLAVDALLISPKLNPLPLTAAIPPASILSPALGLKFTALNDPTETRIESVLARAPALASSVPLSTVVLPV